MNTRNLLYGVLAAALCFFAGLLADRLPAQNKAASEWRYKAVDLNWELLVGKDGKLPDPFAFDLLDAGKLPRRAEELLEKHGAGGELVSYGGGTAVYKRRAE